MKKLLILSGFILLTAQINAQMILKAGLDINGEHKVSVEGQSGTLDVKSGFNLGLEGYKEMNENVDIGLGIGLQIPREQKVPSDIEGESGKFSFLPIYTALRIHPAPSNFNGFGVIQLGYNMFNGDSDYKGDASLSGGICYGFGGGVIMNNSVIVEILYSVNNGSASFYGTDFDVRYSKVNINLGIVLGGKR